MSSLAVREIRPSGSTLVLLAPERDRICLHGIEGYPYEVVGILAGDRSANRVTRAVPLVNERADSPANRYRVDGLQLMRAETRLAAEGLDVVGYYHSHPDHPSMWSDEDRDLALPNVSYLIVSVRDGKAADMRSWRLREDRSAMDSEEIRIEPQ